MLYHARRFWACRIRTDGRSCSTRKHLTTISLRFSTVTSVGTHSLYTHIPHTCLLCYVYEYKWPVRWSVGVGGVYVFCWPRDKHVCEDRAVEQKRVLLLGRPIFGCRSALLCGRFSCDGRRDMNSADDECDSMVVESGR